MELITSKHNPKIKALKRVNKENCFLTTSLPFIKKADKQGLLKAVYVHKKIVLKAPVYLVTPDVIKEPIIGVVRYLISKPISENKIIYLDEITDPTNLAKIIMLMKKYNYHDLIISPRSVSVYNAKCLTMINDLLFDVNIVKADIKLLQSLQKAGYKILSTGLKGAKKLDEINSLNKYVLVFGNEARGVNVNILKLSDAVIKIPIQNLDSLNIAVAASIVIDKLS